MNSVSETSPLEERPAAPPLRRRHEAVHQFPPSRIAAREVIGFRRPFRVRESHDCSHPPRLQSKADGSAGPLLARITIPDDAGIRHPRFDAELINGLPIEEPQTA